MFKEQTIKTHNRAIGMLEGGLTQKFVVRQIGVNIRIRRL